MGPDKQAFQNLKTFSSFLKDPRKIVAFGNVLIDRTVQLPDLTIFDTIPITVGTKGELEAETLTKIANQVCERFKCQPNPGGSALNTVRILKQLGSNALFFGSIGDDESGKEIQEILNKNGIEARLQIIDSMPTGQCLSLVYNDQATLHANIGASSKFSIEFLKQEAESNTTFLRPTKRKQIIYIEGFFIPQRENVCEFIIKNYIKNRCRLALNLSAKYIVEENFEHVKKMAENSLIVFGNAGEFAAFAKCSGYDTVEELVKELMENDKDGKIIVITNGEKGAEVMTNYECEGVISPALQIYYYHAQRINDIIDTTGAGDAFVGGFFQCWLKKCSIDECVRMGISVAAQSCTQIGCNLP